MSFNCGACGEHQGSRSQPIKVVTQMRKVTYPAIKSRDGRERIPEGWEIAKELDVCQSCASKMKR